MIITIVIGVVFGLVAGFFVERSSHRRDPVYGGSVARVLHYMSASAVAALPVTVTAVVITSPEAGWMRLGYGLLTALGLSAVMYGSAFLFARIERPARDAALARKAQAGWTEEDARSSGL
jgi:hypothetical protein